MTHFNSFTAEQATQKTPSMPSPAPAASALLACRQMAAAAATFSDSWPPGWAMRMRSSALAASAGDTPCPSWPMIEAQGQGNVARCRYSPACGLVTSMGSCSACSSAGPPGALDQIQREMCAHPGAQRFRRPECGAAFECQHRPESEGCCTAQDRAHVACILHPVQYHGGGARLQAGGPGQAQNEAHARRRFQGADAGKQWLGKNHYLACVLRIFGLCLRPERLGKYGDRWAQLARQCRAAQVLAFQPQPALSAVGGAVLGQPAQFLDEGVVARVDGAQGGGAHRQAPGRLRATGANERRWWMQAPCARSAARCMAVP